MRHARLRTVAVLAVAAAAVRPSFRPAAAAPAAPAGPVQVIAMGAAPIDDWTKTIEDLAGKEAADQFRGLLSSGQATAPWTKELRTDAPFGATVYAGTGMPVQASLAVVMPVNAGKVTADDLKAGGGTAVAGSPDVIQLAGQNYAAKRTADDLLVSPLTDLLAKATQQSMLDATAHPGGPLSLDKPGTLFVMGIDVAAWRANDPDFQKAIDGWRGQDAHKRTGTPADQAGQQAGADLVFQAVDAVRTVSFALSADADTVRVSSAFTPGDMAPPKPRPRPAFPDGCVGRADFTYATAAQARWFDRSLDWFADAMKAEMAADPDMAVGMAAIRKAATELLTGRAMSVALRPAEGGKFVVYVVEEVDGEPDVAATLTGLADECHRLAPAGSAKVEPYDEAGQHVSRFTIADAGAAAPAFVIDATRAGHTVRLTMAVDAAHHMAELLAAKPDGTQTGKVCDGSIDAAAAVRLAAETPGTPLYKLDPAAKAQIAGLFAGQQVSFSLDGYHHHVLLEVAAPRPLVRTLVQLGVQAR